MKKEQIIALAVAIFCALALLIGAVVGIFTGYWNDTPENKKETAATTEETTETKVSGELCEDPQPEQQGGNSGNTPEKQETTAGNTPDKNGSHSGEEQVTPPPPTDLPATVVIPTEKDPQTGKDTGVKFPCQVPGYDLKLEKLAPYDGMFVENGTNVAVEQVAMLLVENKGGYPIQYTQICVEYGQEQLLFDISALPVGEKLVVQEKSGKAIPQGEAGKATALVVQQAEMEMSEDKIRVTDNGNNTLTVENLTEDTIPTTRVFYKYYMQEEDVFVGGIAFNVRITQLAGKSKVTVQPAHYNSKTGRVVMVQTYEK